MLASHVWLVLQYVDRKSILHRDLEDCKHLTCPVPSPPVATNADLASAAVSAWQEHSAQKPPGLQNTLPFLSSAPLLLPPQILLALQYVHGKSILHRDLKTANIFLTKEVSTGAGGWGGAGLQLRHHSLLPAVTFTSREGSTATLKLQHRACCATLQCTLFTGRHQTRGLLGYRSP